MHLLVDKERQKLRWPSASGSSVDMKEFSKRMTNLPTYMLNERECLDLPLLNLPWVTSMRLAFTSKSILRRLKNGMQRPLSKEIRMLLAVLMD
jgi:hypothetical protein